MNILEIIGVTKNYAAHRALDNISLNIKEGSVYGLLGPNGAGKTSLIRIITQINAPDQGELIFRGQPLSNVHTLKMGFLPPGLDFKFFKPIFQFHHCVGTRQPLKP